ncbi:hypothetical protein PUR34_02025 [Streptomyces sp. JV185]|uniref:hypothetical protein n=1 Tax=Streptomyces sp. JV185 TaxID=858638 RepID=UPI002E77C2C8|nr:hypothetical protein [Streptomyces sp. JV185]MEE1767013.1 hypothetical protein [Streptomyces sp. JV185]
MLAPLEPGGWVGDRGEEAGEQAPLLGADSAIGRGCGDGRLDDADGQQDDELLAEGGRYEELYRTQFEKPGSEHGELGWHHLA